MCYLLARVYNNFFKRHKLIDSPASVHNTFVTILLKESRLDLVYPISNEITAFNERTN